MKLNYFNAALRVCVDQLEHGAAGGCVYGPRLKEPLVFHDLSGLLLQIDAILDAQDFPRAYQRKRSFAREAPPALPEEVFVNDEFAEERQGRVCTFIINIFSRQNTTWQGVVYWLDQREPLDFYSELALLQMLDEEFKKYQ